MAPTATHIVIWDGPGFNKENKRELDKQTLLYMALFFRLATENIKREGMGGSLKDFTFRNIGLVVTLVMCGNESRPTESQRKEWATFFGCWESTSRLPRRRWSWDAHSLVDHGKKHVRILLHHLNHQRVVFGWLWRSRVRQSIQLNACWREL